MSIEKSKDAYRTITEVSKSIEIPQHVLRFWETKFTQIKPLKRGGGRRYYNPQDVDLLRGIKHMLYVEGFTIKGVQKVIKEKGIKAVINSPQMIESESQQKNSSNSLQGEEEIIVPNPDDFESVAESQNTSVHVESAAVPDSSMYAGSITDAEETDSEHLPKDLLPENTEKTQSSKSSFGLFERLRNDGGKNQTNSSNSGVQNEKDIKRLQDTLYELLECKRILDSAR